ncbi:hypothetical protein [Aquimarina litoralis]|uniref:hypothetical protein n=1 Tax=Aquimarina litoralis TaxID=584605 RepID=UPI001C56169B|nr:hypothetical protein [Aquimarina litoralis]
MYIFWTMISIVLGICYMRILVGPFRITKEGLGYILYIFYNLGLFYVGLAVGVVIAFFFILLDVFYLRKKLQNKSASILLRLGFLFFIAAIVAGAHYILEKVIDVI